MLETALLLQTSLVLGSAGLLPLCLNAFVINGLFYDDKTNHLAYAHFFGSLKQIGNYQIVFQPLHLFLLPMKIQP
jgi:hypothetical protein